MLFIHNYFLIYFLVMRLLSAVLLVSLLSRTSVIQAQDANCTAVYSDYSFSANGSGGYQECYTDQAYNAALETQGSNPNYKDILNQACGKPPACSH
ncbi:hypothetical protein EDD21DRAFT_419274 [Dissophora ornata]|nr:hypothetical protein EDD21DRAFT_419274 [Dissophora ornata]